MTENDLSPRQRALAGEFVKEGHSMEDAIQMASVTGAPAQPTVKSGILTLDVAGWILSVRVHDGGYEVSITEDGKCPASHYVRLDHEQADTLRDFMVETSPASQPSPAATVEECPRPVIPDHSAQACVESGNCGCGHNGLSAATEDARETIAQALCGADGNGFLCDCTPTQREAYLIRAGAVLEVMPREPQTSDMWQPIETAPRDKLVLIAGGTFEKSNSLAGECAFTGPTMASYDAWEKLWKGDNAGGHDEFYWHKPTHWMPIPDASQLSRPHQRGGE